MVAGKAGFITGFSGIAAIAATLFLYSGAETAGVATVAPQAASSPGRQQTDIVFAEATGRSVSIGDAGGTEISATSGAGRRSGSTIDDLVDRSGGYTDPTPPEKELHTPLQSIQTPTAGVASSEATTVKTTVATDVARHGESATGQSAAISTETETASAAADPLLTDLTPPPVRSDSTMKPAPTRAGVSPFSASLHRFWGPFNSEMRANSFARHLGKLIEYPLLVQPDGRGYHIAFEYSSAAQQRELIELIRKAGLTLDGH